MRHLDENLASLLVMAWMVEARDPYTGGHLWRVSRYSRLLATAAGLDQEHVARIARGDMDDVLQAAPTGRQGSARDLEPGADIPLIAQIVQESSAAIHTTSRQAEVA